MKQIFNLPFLSTSQSRQKIPQSLPSKHNFLGRVFSHNTQFVFIESFWDKIKVFFGYSHKPVPAPNPSTPNIIKIIKIDTPMKVLSPISFPGNLDLKTPDALYDNPTPVAPPEEIIKIDTPIKVYTPISLPTPTPPSPVSIKFKIDEDRNTVSTPSPPKIVKAETSKIDSYNISWNTFAKVAAYAIGVLGIPTAGYYAWQQMFTPRPNIPDNEVITPLPPSSDQELDSHPIIHPPPPQDMNSRMQTLISYVCHYTEKPQPNHTAPKPGLPFSSTNLPIEEDLCSPQIPLVPMIATLATVVLLAYTCFRYRQAHRNDIHIKPGLFPDKRPPTSLNNGSSITANSTATPVTVPPVTARIETRSSSNSPEMGRNSDNGSPPPLDPIPTPEMIDTGAADPEMGHNIVNTSSPKPQDELLPATLPENIDAGNADADLNEWNSDNDDNNNNTKTPRAIERRFTPIKLRLRVQRKSPEHNVKFKRGKQNTILINQSSTIIPPIDYTNNENLNYDRLISTKFAAKKRIIPPTPGVKKKYKQIVKHDDDEGYSTEDEAPLPPPPPAALDQLHIKDN